MAFFAFKQRLLQAGRCRALRNIPRLGFERRVARKPFLISRSRLPLETGRRRRDRIRIGGAEPFQNTLDGAGIVRREILVIDDKGFDSIILKIRPPLGIVIHQGDFHPRDGVRVEREIRIAGLAFARRDAINRPPFIRAGGDVERDGLPRFVAPFQPEISGLRKKPRHQLAGRQPAKRLRRRHLREKLGKLIIVQLDA
jgi:hypothetical protein